MSIHKICMNYNLLFRCAGKWLAKAMHTMVYTYIYGSQVCVRLYEALRLIFVITRAPFVAVIAGILSAHFA